MDTQWDNLTKKIAAVSLIVLFLYTIHLSQSILAFLVIAGLIAFLLAPMVTFFSQKLRFPKALAIIVAYILLILIVLLIPIILIPAMTSAIQDINIDVIALARQTLDWSKTTLETYRYIKLYNIFYDLSPVVDPALEMLEDISPTTFVPSLDTIIASIPTTLQFTWGIASNVVGRLSASLLAVVLTLLYSIYLTADGGDFVKSLINLAPEAYQPEFSELSRRIKAIWAAYFRGQFVLGLIIGVLTWVIGMIIGLPGALALGVIAGVFEILPNLGPILAAIPALLIALIQGSSTLDVSNLTFMLIVMGAYVLIQQLENNLIVPKVLGDAVELHPLFIMIGVVVGATTAGILGALIAAPTIATARVLIAYTYAKILNANPFPPGTNGTHHQPAFSAQLAWLGRQVQALPARFRKKI